VTEATLPALAVAIDTTSDFAGVAVLEDGRLQGEAGWRTRQNHSREVLPALDWLLSRHGRDKHEIKAVFVCTGPGSYAGMRVGISTAKALGFGLGAPVYGVGRLAADALPFVETGERITVLQAAGRAELAWAVYEAGEGLLREVEPPRLTRAAELLPGLVEGALVCVERASLSDSMRSLLAERRVRVLDPWPGRVASVARLGWLRFAAGAPDESDALAPLYLRAPAIGPQPPRED
jgi:tRNA threonylcarbamoyladenosine biosynthesis protein TsaB